MPIYQEKPVYVTAEQVTQDNMQELADWCNGIVLFKTMPITQRQVELNKESGYTRAAIGDWIVKSSQFHFRAYSPEGFDRKFMEIAS